MMIDILPRTGCCGSDDVSPLDSTSKEGGAKAGNKDKKMKNIPFIVSADDVDEMQQRDHTELFSAIEKQKWDSVEHFLETGQVHGFSMCGLGVGNNVENPDVSTQARTWVFTKNWWGVLTTQSLPIHAAIMYKAPFNLISKLLEAYPEGVRCKDLDGNLPLHLSFKHESPDSVVVLLLKSFPEAVGIKNKSGHQPVDYASADSGAIIQLCIEQTNKAAKREEARLSHALQSEKTRLQDILAQLSEIRGELDHLRKSNSKNAEALMQDAIIKDCPPETTKDDLKDTSTKKKKTSNTKLKFPWSKKRLVAPQS